MERTLKIVLEIQTKEKCFVIVGTSSKQMNGLLVKIIKIFNGSHSIRGGRVGRGFEFIES